MHTILLERTTVQTILNTDQRIMALARFPDVRGGYAHFAAIACGQSAPAAFFELCKAMKLEPEDFPDLLGRSTAGIFDVRVLTENLKYLIQKDYAHGGDIINEDTTNAFIENLLGFLDKNTTYDVYANFEPEVNGKPGMGSELGLGVFQLGMFIFGHKELENTVRFSFAIGFAASMDD